MPNQLSVFETLAQLVRARQGLDLVKDRLEADISSSDIGEFDWCANLVYRVTGTREGYRLIISQTISPVSPSDLESRVYKEHPFDLRKALPGFSFRYDDIEVVCIHPVYGEIELAIREDGTTVTKSPALYAFAGNYSAQFSKLLNIATGKA